MNTANTTAINVWIHDIALKINAEINERYIIKNHISFGNTTLVYLAEDKKTEETVLIKELCPFRMVNRDMDGESLIIKNNCKAEFFEIIKESFENEIEILKKLADNQYKLKGKIPGYLADFCSNGTLYLVTEYFEGNDLKQKILDGNETIMFRKVAYQLVDIVQKVHKSGILHRDIKLSNIFIKEDGTLALLDFGSACTVDNEKETLKYTSNGYSAPEMYEKDDSTLYADIYSVGAVMYQMLTGILPARADLRKPGDLKDITDYTNVPWILENYIMKSLEIKPEKRMKHLSIFKLLL